MSKHHRKSVTVTLPAPAVAPVRVVETATHQECRPHGDVPLEEAIRIRAYQLWERAGRPEGDGVSFWLGAEADLKAGQ